MRTQQAPDQVTIVAHGDDPEDRERIHARIAAEVRATYEDRLREASWLRRLLLKWRMYHEINAHCGELLRATATRRINRDHG